MTRSIPSLVTVFIALGFLLPPAWVAGQSTQEDFTAPPPLPEYPLGVYWTHNDLKRMLTAAGDRDAWSDIERLIGKLNEELGVNLIWVMHASPGEIQRLSAIATTHGIRVLAAPPNIGNIKQRRAPATIVADALTTAKNLGEIDGLTGYVLTDEPHRLDMPLAELYRRTLTQADPARPTVVVARRTETVIAANQLQTDVLCVDLYPFFGAGSPNGPNDVASSQYYFRTVARNVVEIANGSGRIPWIMPQLFQEIWGPWHFDEAGHVVVEPGAYIHYRMPSVGETIWQCWTAVASGAKGVVFFKLFPFAQDRRHPLPSDSQLPLLDQAQPTGASRAMLKEDGRPTPQLEALGEVYRLLASEAELLANMQPAPFPIADVDPPFSATSFLDPASGRYIIVLVNDDLAHSRTADLRFLPHMARIDIKGPGRVSNGRLETPDQWTAPIEIALEPGSGLLIIAEKWQRRTGAVLLDEDFRGAPDEEAVRFRGAGLAKSSRQWEMSPSTVARGQGGESDGFIDLDIARLVPPDRPPRHLYLAIDMLDDEETMLVEITHGSPSSTVQVEVPAGRPTAIRMDATAATIHLSGGAVDRVRLYGVW